MKALGFFCWFALIFFWLQNPASAGPDSLEEVAGTVADALAAGDAVILKRHLLTYEALSGISSKIKRISKEEYEREASQIINSMWREVRTAKMMVDHVEIQEVVIETVEDKSPTTNYVIAVVQPVLTHEGASIRPPMLRMFFVQIGNQWKYSCTP